MPSFLKTIALGAIVSVGLSLSAHAATIFTDRTAFDAVTGPLALETFDTPIARAALITFDGGITSSRSGTTNSPNEVNNFGSFSTLVTRDQKNLITLNFGKQINAFGADFSGLGSLFADLLGTDESVTIASSFQPAGFFGFVSDELFSSLQFRTAPGIGFGSQLFSLDNLLSGTAADVSPVPLPATLPLLLAAFGGIGIMRRRRAH